MSSVKPIESPNELTAKAFNPLKIIIPVLIALLSVSLMAQWYANNVTVPRYCKKPEQTLRHLSILINSNNDMNNENRRDYMIAAKLLFLHPKEDSESKHEYIQRLRYQLLNTCS